MSTLNNLTNRTTPLLTDLTYLIDTGATTDYKCTLSKILGLPSTPDNITVSPASSSQIAAILKAPATPSTDVLQIQNNSASVLFAVDSNGKIDTYNSLTTAGFGIPTIVAANRTTGQTGTNASICTFTPSADGDFRINWSMYISAWTSNSTFAVTLSITDEGSNARNYTCAYHGTSGTISSTSFTSATHYAGVAFNFRAKGGTSITLKTTGTFVFTYNLNAYIEQLG